MSSPVPYSKPRSGLVDRKTTKFRTKKRSFIYAPHSGKIDKIENGVTVTAPNGFKHVLKNVTTFHKAGTEVVTGERIGHAKGITVRYSRYNREGKKIESMSVAKKTAIAVKPTNYFYAAKTRIPTSQGGVMGPGTEVKVVWHTSESDHNSGIGPVADWVQYKGWQYTLLWNPYAENRDERFLQFYPANVGARSLLSDSGYPTNRHGKKCIQICVIGRAADKPLSKSPMYGRRELMEWLDYHKIPRKLTYNQRKPIRSRENWEKSGHTAHIACPGNDHTDPGRINTRKLFGP